MKIHIHSFHQHALMLQSLYTFFSISFLRKHYHFEKHIPHPTRATNNGQNPSNNPYEAVENNARINEIIKGRFNPNLLYIFAAQPFENILIHRLVLNITPAANPAVMPNSPNIDGSTAYSIESPITDNAMIKEVYITCRVEKNIILLDL